MAQWLIFILAVQPELRVEIVFWVESFSEHFDSARLIKEHSLWLIQLNSAMFQYEQSASILIQLK
jgi:hypothetical protein